MDRPVGQRGGGRARCASRSHGCAVTGFGDSRCTRSGSRIRRARAGARAAETAMITCGQSRGDVPPLALDLAAPEFRRGEIRLRGAAGRAGRPVIVSPRRASRARGRSRRRSSARGPAPPAACRSAAGRGLAELQHVLARVRRVELELAHGPLLDGAHAGARRERAVDGLVEVVDRDLDLLAAGHVDRARRASDRRPWPWRSCFSGLVGLVDKGLRGPCRTRSRAFLRASCRSPTVAGIGISASVMPGLPCDLNEDDRLAHRIFPFWLGP